MGSTNSPELMNVVLLHSNDPNAPATHVSIFRVVRIRWPHEWLEHLGDYYVVKLHSLIQVHLLVILINFMHLINPRTRNTSKCISHFLNTHVQHFVLTVVLQLQLRSILRNQTGIEDWIVEKAHHRRNPGDPKFVYPYNLGWKNNLKQVR